MIAASADASPPLAPNCLTLVDGRRRNSLSWRIPASTQRQRELLRWVLIFGIDSTRERNALLHMGHGDVLGGEFGLDELAARARRVVATATMLSPWRRHGPLRLELLARDGYVDGKRLGLHPREFALAWRLMDEPERPIDKATLLRDVWQLEYVPETNSLAVHVRRLRAKLEVAGLPGFVVTTAGGYRLCDALPAEFPANSVVPDRLRPPPPFAPGRLVRTSDSSDPAYLLPAVLLHF